MAMFGTDGIRGKVGSQWIRPAAFAALGQAIVSDMMRQHPPEGGMPVGHDSNWIPGPASQAKPPEDDGGEGAFVCHSRAFDRHSRVFNRHSRAGGNPVETVRSTLHVADHPIQPVILIARDTRESGMLLQAALTAALAAGDVRVVDLGVMPTPTLAYLCKQLSEEMDVVMGLMVTASHNPHTDNGLKFFQANGAKLTASQQARLAQAFEQVDWPLAEQHVMQAEAAVRDHAGAVGIEAEWWVQRYVKHCLSDFASVLQVKGFQPKIVLDCAHGACNVLAPQVFDALGLSYTLIGASPDGQNINQGCGSTQLGALRRAVTKRGADLGVAFDGDGDRVLLVDAQGQLIDGDHLLMALVLYQRAMQQHVPGVVGTVMSNQGLAEALDAMGVAFERSAVGDVHVASLLQAKEWTLGSEPSGHVMNLAYASAGDGLVTCLQFLAWMAKCDRPASAILQVFEKFPQVLKNVAVDGDFDWEAVDAVRDMVADCQERLGKGGRVLLRPSGTEPVLRIMVEGRDAKQVTTLANRLVKAVIEASQTVVQ